MIPEEKAKELVEKFLVHVGDYRMEEKTRSSKAKFCASICVNEILKIAPAADAFNPFRDEEITFVEYFEQVKQSINKTL